MIFVLKFSFCSNKNWINTANNVIFAAARLCRVHSQFQNSLVRLRVFSLSISKPYLLRPVYFPLISLIHCDAFFCFLTKFERIFSYSVNLLNKIALVVCNGEFIFSSERRIQIEPVFRYQKIYTDAAHKTFYWNIAYLAFFTLYACFILVYDDDLSDCCIDVDLFPYVPFMTQQAFYLHNLIKQLFKNLF